jgi:putative glutamine amidotransferase
MASPNPAKKPIVGIPCDRRMVGLHPFHMVGEKYIAAVRGGAGALPLLIPVLQPSIAIDDILASVDGLLFTGSLSNVAPHLYGGHEPRDAKLLDEARDETTLPLLHAAIERGVPAFCLCRGFQELNVALGGTLHQHLEELPAHLDHRDPKDAPVDEKYAPAHEVRVAPGGMLAKIAGQSPFQVNSLHSQGIDRLAPGLMAEATAPDGTIEAVSMPKARGFLLGAQWHPEWRYADNPVSRALFAAFGDAVRAHAQAKDAGARRETELAL